MLHGMAGVPPEDAFRLRVPELRHVRAVLASAGMRCLAAAAVLKQERPRDAPRSEPSTARCCDSAAADGVRVLALVAPAEPGRRGGAELLKLRTVNLRVEHRAADPGRPGAAAEYASYGQLQVSRRWPVGSVTRVLQHDEGRGPPPAGAEVFTVYFRTPRAFSFRSIDHASCTALLVTLVELRGHAILARGPGAAGDPGAARDEPAPVPAPESPAAPGGKGAAAPAEGADMAELVTRLSAAVSRQADLLEVMLGRYDAGAATREERDGLLEVCERARDRLSEAVGAACAADDERVLEETLRANDKMNAVVRRARASGAPGGGGGAAAASDGGGPARAEHPGGGGGASSAPPFEECFAACRGGGSDAHAAWSQTPAFFLERVRAEESAGVREAPSPAPAPGAAPASYFCPITLELFVDPVVAADGHTYEREAIERWFARAAGAAACSPMAGEPFASAALTPNHQLRQAIEEWRGAGGGGGGSAAGRGGGSAVALRAVTVAMPPPRVQPEEHPPLIVL